MKFFDENYSQERPTRSKCLRKKYNLKQTDLDYKEIIFRDIAKFVENLFYHCFSSIIFRDLETVNKRMNSLSDDDLISIQSSCLRLSKTFANFNIQRKKFLISDETEKIIHNGKKVIKKSKKISPSHTL